MAGIIYSQAMPATLRNLARIAASKNQVLSSEPDRPLGRALLQRRFCQTLKTGMAESQKEFEADMFSKVNGRHTAYFATASNHASSSSSSSSDEESDDEATSGLVFRVQAATTITTTTVAIAATPASIAPATVSAAASAPESAATENVLTPPTTCPTAGGKATPETSTCSPPQTPALVDDNTASAAVVIAVPPTPSPSPSSTNDQVVDPAVVGRPVTRSVSAEELASLAKNVASPGPKRASRTLRRHHDSILVAERSKSESPRLVRRDVGQLSDVDIHSLFTGAPVRADT